MEVAVAENEILVRDGKDRAAPPLRFTPTAWTAFLGRLAAGEFAST